MLRWTTHFLVTWAVLAAVPIFIIVDCILAAVEGFVRRWQSEARVEATSPDGLYTTSWGALAVNVPFLVREVNSPKAHCASGFSAAWILIQRLVNSGLRSEDDEDRGWSGSMSVTASVLSSASRALPYKQALQWFRMLQAAYLQTIDVPCKISDESEGLDKLARVCRVICGGVTLQDLACQAQLTAPPSKPDQTRAAIPNIVMLLSHGFETNRTFAPDPAAVDTDTAQGSSNQSESGFGPVSLTSAVQPTQRPLSRPRSRRASASSGSTPFSRLRPHSAARTSVISAAARAPPSTLCIAVPQDWADAFPHGSRPGRSGLLWHALYGTLLLGQPGGAVTKSGPEASERGGTGVYGTWWWVVQRVLSAVRQVGVDAARTADQGAPEGGLLRWFWAVRSNMALWTGVLLLSILEPAVDLTTACSPHIQQWIALTNPMRADLRTAVSGVAAVWQGPLAALSRWRAYVTGEGSKGAGTYHATNQLHLPLSLEAVALSSRDLLYRSGALDLVGSVLRPAPPSTHTLIARYRTMHPAADAPSRRQSFSMDRSVYSGGIAEDRDSLAAGSPVPWRGAASGGLRGVAGPGRERGAVSAGRLGGGRAVRRAVSAGRLGGGRAVRGAGLRSRRSPPAMARQISPPIAVSSPFGEEGEGGMGYGRARVAGVEGDLPLARSGLDMSELGSDEDEIDWDDAPYAYTGGMGGSMGGSMGESMRGGLGHGITVDTHRMTMADESASVDVAGSHALRGRSHASGGSVERDVSGHTIGESSESLTEFQRLQGAPTAPSVISDGDTPSSRYTQFGVHVTPRARAGETFVRVMPDQQPSAGVQVQVQRGPAAASTTQPPESLAARGDTGEGGSHMAHSRMYSASPFMSLYPPTALSPSVAALLAGGVWETGSEPYTPSPAAHR